MLASNLDFLDSWDILPGFDLPFDDKKFCIIIFLRLHLFEEEDSLILSVYEQKAI